MKAQKKRFVFLFEGDMNRIERNYSRQQLANRLFGSVICLELYRITNEFAFYRVLFLYVLIENRRQKMIIGRGKFFEFLKRFRTIGLRFHQRTRLRDFIQTANNKFSNVAFISLISIYLVNSELNIIGGYKLIWELRFWAWL